MDIVDNIKGHSNECLFLFCQKGVSALNRGKEMVRECVECNNKQIGYSNRDGNSCEKCGGYTDPKGWVHVGIDLAKGKDITAVGNGHHFVIIDELYDTDGNEEALRNWLNMQKPVMRETLSKVKV